MKVTDLETDRIQSLLKQSGIESQDLLDDVLDHICTAIEHSPGTDFEQALHEALTQFGGLPELRRLQTRLDIALGHRRHIKKKVAVYRSAYFTISLFLCATGFVIMHWPYSRIIGLASAACFWLFFIPCFIAWQRSRLDRKRLLL